MGTAEQERTWTVVEPPRRFHGAATAAVVLAVVFLTLGLLLWQTWSARSAYGPDEVDARVSLRLVPEERAQATVDALVGPGRLQVPIGFGPLLVGQAGLDVPAGATDDSFFTLFVLEAGQGRPLAHVFAATTAATVGQGWDGSYGTIAQQVPWLAGIASPPAQDGLALLGGEPAAVSWRGTTRGPITFVAIPPWGMADPSALSSYTVALTLQREDRSLVWAEQLTPTAP